MRQTGPENPLYQLQRANRAGVKNPRPPSPVRSSCDMRLHPRLYAALAMKCQVILLEAEKSWDGAGTLKNISFGGVYFTCAAAAVGGTVRNFSLNPGLPARVRLPLKRPGPGGAVERPAPDQAVLGIAVKFLTPAAFPGLGAGRGRREAQPHAGGSITGRRPVPLVSVPIPP